MLGIETVLDVLQHYPRRYLDRTKRSENADVSTWQIQKLVAEALTRAVDFADPLADDVRDEHRLVERTAAYRGIHRPESEDDWRTATRRLIFDEFLRMQVGMVARKRAI